MTCLLLLNTPTTITTTENKKANDKDDSENIGCLLDDVDHALSKTKQDNEQTKTCYNVHKHDEGGIHFRHPSPSLLTQDVVLTSIQRHLNVMDVRWTSKQRCVLTTMPRTLLFVFIYIYFIRTSNARISFKRECSPNVLNFQETFNFHIQKFLNFRLTLFHPKF